MKTFGQIQTILTENRTPLDPAGMPEDAMKKIPGHTQIRYKMLWKKMGLPEDFETRIKAMGGEVLTGDFIGHTGYHFQKKWRERYQNGFPEMKTWHRNGNPAFERFMYDGSLHSKDGNPSFTIWDRNGIKEVEIWHKKGQVIKRLDGK